MKVIHTIYFTRDELEHLVASALPKKFDGVLFEFGWTETALR